MEDILNAMLKQNEAILNVLNVISDKLDILETIDTTLDEVVSAIGSLESELQLLEVVPVDMALDIQSIKFSISSVQSNLQWHEDLSAASQIIKAIDGVADLLVKVKPI